MTVYEPTSARSRKGRPAMSPEQQRLADELSRRAAAIWSEADGELSITEAVNLAAVQLGLESPQVTTSEEAE